MIEINQDEQLYQLEKLGKSPLEKLFDLLLLLEQIKIYSAYLWGIEKQEDVKRENNG